ncbi:NAD(P)-dependent oxidoreductase [Streptomyces sp. MST-110588]|uniref:NAD-dependent epimerase/dehydratase family protein n=1 Tax=Streptomyces sp. MST-110588 TaxID=2833628 RepID=UPI001F5CA3B9|nr:NAD(P)-dependent oxidoreductase [Streptomyces sp. MST-110588]UNO40760.1 NAD(P)-dependent oxidoreductase [Streptomyces sp. MST-110588]
MENAGRAMVFGGTGFVGRHICAAFAHHGWDVVAVSRRPAQVSGARTAVALDVVRAAPADVGRLLADHGPDVVVNAAGSYWGLDEEGMRASFGTLTARLLAALAARPAPARLVHLGTVMEHAPTPRGQALTERSPLGPTGAYGRAKLAATRAVLDSGLDALVLRLTNSVGPGVHRQSLVGKVAQALHQAREAGTRAEITLAPLRAERDYLDVRDLGDAVVAAASATARGVVNIGSGHAYPVRDLVGDLVRLSGVPARITEREPGAGGPVAPGAAAEWLRVDPATARELLGWAARRTLSGALADLWAAGLRAPAGV